MKIVFIGEVDLVKKLKKYFLSFLIYAKIVSFTDLILAFLYIIIWIDSMFLSQFKIQIIDNYELINI